MKKGINLLKYLDQTPCGERLLAVIVDELDTLSRYNVENKLDNTTVEKLYALGIRLLTHDYFVESEKIYNEWMQSDDSVSEMLYENFRTAQLADVCDKRADYDEFFRIINENIEEWCE